MQSPDRHRPLRHLYSSDNMHAQNFNIPNLKIEQRKTSSAEDMVRKNSAGKWYTNKKQLFFDYSCNDHLLSIYFTNVKTISIIINIIKRLPKH